MPMIIFAASDDLPLMPYAMTPRCQYFRASFRQRRRHACYRRRSAAYAQRQHAASHFATPPPPTGDYYSS